MTPFVTWEAVLDAVPLQDVKRYPNLCETCGTRICVEICSGEAITASPEGQPQFDREKCIHCGACVWNCEQTLPHKPEKTNIEFRAGAGGLHSTEN